MFRILKLEDRIVLDGAGDEALHGLEAPDEIVDLDSGDVRQERSGYRDDLMTTDTFETENTDGLHVIVIPSSIPDGEDLAKAAKDNVRVVQYDPDDPAMTLGQLEALIGQSLEGEAAASIAFATHGSDGSNIQLASGQITTLENLLEEGSSHQDFWKVVGGFVKDGGRIDLLGCNVVDDAEGGDFLDAIEKITGVNVAASIDATGNEAYGGNWVLETDDVDVAETYFDSEALDEFEGVLQNRAPHHGDVASGVLRGISSVSNPDGETTYFFGFPSNTFIDPDGDTLTYTSDAPTSAPWLTFYPGSLAFYGVAGTAQEGQTYPITVTATDPGGLTDSLTFTVSVPAGGEALPAISIPTSFSGSVPEAPATGTGATIVDLGVTDTDSTTNTFDWDIVSGNPQSSSQVETFAIDSNGVITVNDTSRLNYEDPLNPNHSFSLTVQVKDDQGLYATKIVNFSITDVNENLPFASISKTGNTVFAEDGGQTTVTVTLSKDVSTTTTVPLNFTGTAGLNTDFNANQTSVIFTQGGALSQTVTIDGIDDTTTVGTEGPEPFTVSLASGTSYSLGSPSSADFTITDETIPPTVNLNTPSPGSFAEGEQTTITATASEAPTADLSVPISIAGATVDAQPGVDIDSGATASLTFKAGQTISEPLVIKGIADADDTEGSETFDVTLNTGTGYNVGTSDQVAFTVTDTAVGPLLLNLDLTGPATIEEAGGQTTVTINLSRTITSSVTAVLSYSGDTDNFVSLPANVTIDPADGLSKTFTLTGQDDGIAEGNRTFTVTLVDQTDYDLGTTPNVTGNITDEVFPTVNIGLTNASFSEAGGTTQITATADTAPTTDLVIPLNLTGATTAAQPGTDIDVGATASITIPANQLTSTQPLVISGIADFDETEGNESFTVSLGQQNGFTAGTTPEVTFTVTDAPAPDLPEVSLQIQPFSFSENGGQAQVSAFILNTVDFTVEVPLIFSPQVEEQGKAVEGIDYNALGQTIVINPGETSSFIILEGVLDNDPDEGNETVTVSLDEANLVNAVAGVQNQAQAVLTEASPPVATLSGTGGALAEATQDSTTITGTLSTTRTSDINLLLQVTKDANLTMGQDFTATYSDGTTVSTDTNGNWILPIQSGSLTNGIKITALDDNFFEVDEILDLQLIADTNNTYQVDPATTQPSVTIIDDDDTNQPLVSLSKATLSVSEVGSGTVTLQLDQAPGADTTVLLDLTDVYGNPVLDTDYEVLDDQGTNIPVQNGQLAVTFPAFDSQMPLTIKGLEDSIFESIPVFDTATDTYTYQDETFNLTIAGADLAQVDPAGISTTEVSIVDNEAIPSLVLNVTGDPVNVTEDGGTASVGINLTPATGTTVEYDLVATLTPGATDVAKPGVDYDFASLTPVLNANNDVTGWYATIAGGTTTTSVVVTGQADTILEGDEAFTIQAVSQEANDSGIKNFLIVNENDVDEGAATVFVDANSLTSATFQENGGTTDVKVFLDHAVAGSVTVNVTLAGDAVFGTTTSPTANDDYTAVEADGTEITSSTFPITIPEGDTTGTFTLTAVPDATPFYEIGETISVTLNSVTPEITGNASLDTTQDTVTATIQEEQAQPTVNLAFQDGSTSSAFPEDIGAKIVQAVLSHKTEEPVTVNLDFAEGTPAAIAGEDYTPATTITVNPGSLTGSVGVPIIDDTILEEDEVFTVSIAGTPTNATLGTTTTITGTIQSDTTELNSPAQVQATFADGDSTFNEAGDDTATLKFFVDRAITTDLKLDLAFGGEALLTGADQDYTATVVGGNAIMTTPYTLTIPAATSSQTVEVLLEGISDTDFEGNESVAVAVSVIEGGANANGNTAELSGGPTVNLTGTLVDSSAEPEVSLKFKAADGTLVDTFSAEEGQGGTIVSVLEGTTTQPVTVTIQGAASTGVGEAAPGTDYEFNTTTQTNPTQTITIPAGSLTAPLGFQLKTDILFEGDETFKLDITGVIGPAQNAVEDSLTGTIIDTNEAPKISLLGPELVATELNTTAANLQVALTTPSVGDMSFTVDLYDETATQQAEYNTTTPANGDYTLTVEETDVTAADKTFGTNGNSSFTFDGKNLDITWAQEDQGNAIDLVITAVQEPAGQEKIEADEFIDATLTGVPTSLATITTPSSQTVTIVDDDYTAPTLTLTAESNDTEFSESGQELPVQLNLELSTTATLAFTVDVDFTSTSASVAIPGTDYKATQEFTGTSPYTFNNVDTATGTGSISVNVPGGAKSVPIYLNAIDDTIFEGNETFTATVDVTPAAGLANAGADVTETVTIIENEAAPEVSVKLSSGATFSEDTGTLPLTIAWSQQAPTTEPVTLTFSGGADFISGANVWEPRDYALVDSNGNTLGPVAADGTVDIAIPADTANTYKVTLKALGDLVFEGDETITVSVTSVPTDWKIDPDAIDNTVSATLTDNDPKPTLSVGTINPVSADEGTGTAPTNSTTFSVPLNFSSVLGSDTVVTFNFTGDTTPDTDFYQADVGGTPGTFTANGSLTVTVPAGTTSTALNLLTEPDSLFEANETFNATLAADDPNAPTFGYLVGTADSATGTIVDDDTAPTISMTVSTPSFVEGATPVEKLQFNLTDSLGNAVTLGSPVTVKVDVDETATTGLNVTGSATPEVDFTLFGGATYDTATGLYLVTIPAGTTSVSFDINNTDDTEYEGGTGNFENLKFDLTDSGMLTTATPTPTATVQIEDNDAAPGVTMQITPTTIAEGDSASGALGTAGNIVVSLVDTSGNPMTIGLDRDFQLTFTNNTAEFADYAVDGNVLATATATQTFTLTAGQSSVSIPLAAFGDLLNEPDETFTVSFGEINTSDFTGTLPADIDVTISDNTPPPEVDFGQTTLPVVEGGTPVTISATIDNTIFQDETITLDLSGTAVLGTDYSVKVDTDNDGDFADETPIVTNQPTFTFPSTIGANTPTAVLQITPLDPDLIFQDPRTVSVTIADSGGNLGDANASEVTVNISDNDPAPEVKLEFSGNEVAEDGSKTVGVKAVLDVDGDGLFGETNGEDNAKTNIEVTLNNVLGTAEADDFGFTPDPPVITILAGSSVSSSSVFYFGVQEAAGSEEYEGNETFTVDIATATNANDVETGNTITVIEDEQGPTVNLSVSPLTINEAADTAAITLNLTSTSPITETVFLSFNGASTATITEDFVFKTGVGGSTISPITVNGQDVIPVTIPANTLSTQIILESVNDDLGTPVFELDETVEVAIAGFQNNLQEGVNNAATVTILDDDDQLAPTVSLSFSDKAPQTAAEIDEDGIAKPAFVLMSQSSAAPVEITLNLSTGPDAIYGTDFTIDFPFGSPLTFDANNEATLTVPANTSQVLFSVTPISDNVFEGDETFSLTITNAVAGIVDTANDQLDVTINDDNDISVISIHPDVDLDGSKFNTISDTDGADEGTIEETDDDQTGKYFVIHKSSTTAEAITVGYTIEATSTATAGEDYTFNVSGTAILGVDDGDYKLPAFTLIGDEFEEGVETVTVNLTSVAPLGNISTTTGSATLTITDNTDPDAAPVLNTLNPLTVTEGAIAGIGAGIVTFTDADAPVDDPNTTAVNESLASIEYQIVDVPTSGILFLDANGDGANGFDTGDTELVAGDTFTQDDISKGLVFYDHYGPGVDPETGSTLTDNFTFVVTDGANVTYSDPATNAPFTLDIQVQDVPDVPQTESDIFSKTENEAGFVGVLATDLDPGEDLLVNSQIMSGDPNAQFELVQTFVNGTDDTDGVVLELHVAAGNELDYENTPSYTLEVSVDDGDTGAQSVNFVVNVTDVLDDGFNVGDIPDTAWTSADGDFIYDVSQYFPKQDATAVYQVSGMPSWLHFQTSTQTFWAESGSGETGGAYSLTVSATYYGGNGDVIGVASDSFTLNVIASLESQSLLEALDYLENEESAELPEEGEAVEIQEVMMVAHADLGSSEETAEYVDALALLEDENGAAVNMA